MTKPFRHRLYVLLLLPAFIWLIYNNAANRHLHLVGHGWLISHAHPYDHSGPLGKSGPLHKHNEAQLIVLSQITHLLDLAILVAAFRLIIIKEFQTRPVAIYTSQLLHTTFNIPLFRGPPVLAY